MDSGNILVNIQCELKAPKSQYNSFGKYNYRNCEDILEAVKPIAKKYGAAVTCTDEIVLIGERYYVKATATLLTPDYNYSAVAYAREPKERKGMDDSQITGASSSYARKYALNGLFAIDDTKDADFTNKGEEKEIKQTKKAPAPKEKELSPLKKQINELCEIIAKETNTTAGKVYKQALSQLGLENPVDEGNLPLVVSTLQGIMNDLVLDEDIPDLVG